MKVAHILHNFNYSFSGTEKSMVLIRGRVVTENTTLTAYLAPNGRKFKFIFGKVSAANSAVLSSFLFAIVGVLNVS